MRRVAAIVAISLALGLALPFGVGAASLNRLDGFNVIAVPGHPFGGASAYRSLMAARRIGADAVAIIPFLWQAKPSATVIDRGSAMSDAVLREAIRQAHAVGLKVTVKPHVWVPGTWAGAIDAGSDDGWHAWFVGYRAALVGIAKSAAAEHAEALVVGTELARTIVRPEWNDLIAALRSIYDGELLYVAHDVAEAEAVPFWDRLDAVGVSLYPPLGSAADAKGRRAAMRAIVERLDALASSTGKPVLVGEVGLRSATGATAKPWESPEERAAAADPLLQAQVLADWFATLDRPTIRGVMVWRWFTDPDAGGPNDTDFTVQGKPAEGVLLCIWVTGCAKR